ncbi:MULTISPECIES: VCBS repeat-containing protein [Stenotrophomonas]|uniref:FG-GAP repeat domain-containing protein n=1 Tax=Stenotrophomonas TaxID=40323 RepID=UPI00087347F0|nr:MULTISPECIES: VCBS repeat-containing protein [Stenotrophomonas]
MPTTTSSLLLAALCGASFSTGAAPAGSTTKVFTDVTATHVPTDADLHALDGAMLDADGDGDLDVAVAVENGANRLYLNDGTGRLSHAPGAFGTIVGDYEHVRVADFDRDGHPDVLFIAEDTEQHQLYFGDGKGGFRRVGERLPATSQANGVEVGDVNGDGLPDIVIGNTTEGKTGVAQPFLWLNDPARPGHFIDATRTHLPRIDVQAQGIVLADLDGDGDLDMAIASQDPVNRLLLNDGNGRFSDATDRLGRQIPMETREVHALDANGDGRLDLVFFNLTSNNRDWDKDPQTRLLINQGDARFKDETAARLPKHRFSSWGGTVVDFNQDGHPDLVVSAIEVPGFKPLQVRAWQNDGKGNFSDVSAAVIPAETVGRSWSMAGGDLDGDGRPDLFIGGWQSQARLLLSGE